MSALSDDIKAYFDDIKAQWPFEPTVLGEIERSIFRRVMNHEEKIERSLASQAPVEDLSEERKLGYRLGLMDAMGIVSGEIKPEAQREPHAMQRGKRPALNALKDHAKIFHSKLEARKSTIDEILPLTVAVTGLALIEAIDAHAKEVNGVGGAIEQGLDAIQHWMKP
jgi:hypothetical protein